MGEVFIAIGKEDASVLGLWENLYCHRQKRWHCNRLIRYRQTFYCHR